MYVLFNEHLGEIGVYLAKFSKGSSQILFCQNTNLEIGDGFM